MVGNYLGEDLEALNVNRSAILVDRQMLAEIPEHYS